MFASYSALVWRSAYGLYCPGGQSRHLGCAARLCGKRNCSGSISWQENAQGLGGWLTCTPPTSGLLYERLKFGDGSGRFRGPAFAGAGVFGGQQRELIARKSMPTGFARSGPSELQASGALRCLVHSRDTALLPGLMRWQLDQDVLSDLLEYGHQ